MREQLIEPDRDRGIGIIVTFERDPRIEVSANQKDGLARVQNSSAKISEVTSDVDDDGHARGG